jgi:hypothetical protein
MKSTFRIYIFAILVFSFYSCAGIGHREISKGFDKRTRNEYMLEGMSLLGDEGVVTSSVTEAKETGEADEFNFAPSQQRDSNGDDRVFSAQVFASKSNSEARNFMESVAQQFKDVVKIDYQEPYYRVCVGSAKGFEEAQELLKRVNAMGYSKAWLVKLRK